MSGLSLLADGGCFFEGPRWRDGRWWVSDFYRHGVFTVTPDGDMEKVLEMPQQSSGLGWLPDGSLLVVSMLDHKILRRRPDGGTEIYADLNDHATGHVNDMVVAEDGTAWVGNFGFDLMGGADLEPATLVRIDTDGTVTPAAGDLWFPNGMVITPDGRTLVVGETFGNCMTAFTIEADGKLSNRRPWAAFGECPERGPRRDMLKQLAVGPDGCCLGQGPALPESGMWKHSGCRHSAIILTPDHARCRALAGRQPAVPSPSCGRNRRGGCHW